MAACPYCRDQESVRPVSVVYEEASAGGSTSDLAWLLAPPRIEPRLPDSSYRDREENRVLLPVMVLVVLIGVVAAMVGYGFGGFLIVALPGGLVGLIVAKMFASARYDLARAAALAAAAEAEQAPDHRQRRQQWEDARYCPKDEIVFFGDDEAPLTPVEFRNLMLGVAPPAASAEQSTA